MTLRIAMIKQVVALLLVPLLVFSMARSPALAQAPPPAPDDQAWPREFRSGSTTFTVYQPQRVGKRAISQDAPVSVRTRPPEGNSASSGSPRTPTAYRDENQVT
jgi:hypothetical protein